VNSNIVPLEVIKQEEEERAKRYKDKGEVMGNEVDEEDDEEDSSAVNAKIQSSSQLQKKFQAMTTALCEVVNDYALVSFYPMNVNDVTVRVTLIFFFVVVVCMRNWICLLSAWVYLCAIVQMMKILLIQFALFRYTVLRCNKKLFLSFSTSFTRHV
jgi:hypothetical protein